MTYDANLWSATEAYARMMSANARFGLIPMT